MRRILRDGGRWVDVALTAALAAVLFGVVTVFVYLMAPARAEPRPEPATVTRSYFAEKDARGNETGKLCTQALAQTRTGVAVALSCSYPPAESRIADLLEGAGQ